MRTTRHLLEASAIRAVDICRLLTIILREYRESGPVRAERLSRLSTFLKTFDHLTVVGLREWVALPDLGVAGLRAKIDTGASTSSLHATDIEPFERNGEKWVRFTAHLGTVVQLRHRRCEAPLVTRKTIKSSNGQAQVRYVISTTLALGDRVWAVEFTLACRKSMRYRLLLGSKALIDGQLVVNPGIKYVQDKPVFPVSTSSTGVA
ncbi:hypothetical protein PseAD21_04505 [Pseudomonas sp. AD21]|nr:hypothetical protein PseAD21_04505 [Pseudomonas sp. AD21]